RSGGWRATPTPAIRRTASGSRARPRTVPSWRGCTRRSRSCSSSWRASCSIAGRSGSSATARCCAGATPRRAPAASPAGPRRRGPRSPPVDWADPCKLSDGEARCLAELVREFTSSRTLWSQMAFVVSHGRMWLRRDLCAIFHGCVPVDDAGEPLALVIDGEPRRGKALFDAFERVVQRAFQRALRNGIDEVAELDRDLIFYLWTGPRSPCFGKDRMATFETYLVADRATHEEIKNPYFRLLQDSAFCARMLAEFGVDPV